MMKLIGLFSMVALSVATSACSSSPSHQQEQKTVVAKRVHLSDLGEEHIRNSAFRRAKEGNYIAVWGNRVLEWPLPGPSEAIVRVPPRGDIWFSNGGTALDVDHDGDDDLVTAWTHTKAGDETTMVWYEESGDDRWNEHVIATIDHGNWQSPHDILPLHIGDDRGVAVVIGRQDLLYYTIPDDPRTAWTRHEIGSLPVYRQSGMLIDDIDGDGIDDIVVGMFWIRAPSDIASGTWEIRRFGTFDEDERGGMAKHAWIDADDDGMNELIVTQAEIPESRLGYFDPEDDPTAEPWAYTAVDSGLYAPHSMVSADFNDDGRADLIVGEMTAGGWSYPMNDNPTIYAYMQVADGEFERIPLVQGLGIHELGLAPEGVDGRYLIYGADEIQPQKFDNMNTHVSYWLVGPPREE